MTNFQKKKERKCDVGERMLRNMSIRHEMKSFILWKGENEIVKDSSESLPFHRCYAENVIIIGREESAQEKGVLKGSCNSPSFSNRAGSLVYSRTFLRAGSSIPTVSKLDYSSVFSLGCSHCT